MGDIENVTKKTLELDLGGETRTLRYGMRAWGEIQKSYHGLEGIGKKMQEDQPGTIIALVNIGLVKEEGETISLDKIADMLDAYTIGECVKIATDIMELIKSSLPQPKEGAPAAP